MASFGNRARRDMSLPNDDGFQIVRGDRDGASARVAVIALCQCGQVAMEGLATFCGQGVKRTQRRAVVGPEEGHVVFRGSEPEDGRPWITGHGRRAVAEEFTLIVFVAPADRRLQARSWRQIT